MERIYAKAIKNAKKSSPILGVKNMNVNTISERTK